MPAAFFVTTRALAKGEALTCALPDWHRSSFADTGHPRVQVDDDTEVGFGDVSGMDSADAAQTASAAGAAHSRTGSVASRAGGATDREITHVTDSDDELAAIDAPATPPGVWLKAARAFDDNTAEARMPRKGGTNQRLYHTAKAIRLKAEGKLTDENVEQFAQEAGGKMTVARGIRRARAVSQTTTPADTPPNSDDEYQSRAARAQRAQEARELPDHAAALVAYGLAVEAGTHKVAYLPTTVLDCRAAARYTLEEGHSPTRLAYPKDADTGVVMVPPQRCSHTDDKSTDDATRCKATAFLGDLCAIHLDTDMGLEIRPSSIRPTHEPNFHEWGLFATRRFQPYERVGPYAGDRCASSSTGPYVVADTRDMSAADREALSFAIDGARSNAGYMRLINSNHDTPLKNNCCIHGGRLYPTSNGDKHELAWAMVRALSSGIDEGAELLMSYGPQYWQQHQQNISTGPAVSNDADLEAYIAAEQQFRTSASGDDADPQHDFLPPAPGDTASPEIRAMRRKARAQAIAARRDQRKRASFPHAPTLKHRLRPPPPPKPRAAKQSPSKKRTGDTASGSSAKRQRVSVTVAADTVADEDADDESVGRQGMRHAAVTRTAAVQSAAATSDALFIEWDARIGVHLAGSPNREERLAVFQDTHRPIPPLE